MSHSNQGFQTFPWEKANGIRMLVLDVDGVLTAGGITMNDQKEESKTFNVRDGHGIKMVQRIGIEVAILTGRNSQVVTHRANDLGIRFVIQGSLRKKDGLAELVKISGIQASECAYMGDDVIDMPAMRECRLQTAPADAYLGVRNHAHWIADFPGGGGAVRQLCEGLILANGGWPTIIRDAYGLEPHECGWPLLNP
ncbi:MAG: HAD-IIIA family hydrolase [Zetaproteobacteria bacterium]|nr:HAD-IIIA family hydrolase [Zetaproteobacteria bacterium]